MQSNENVILRIRYILILNILNLQVNTISFECVPGFLYCNRFIVYANIERSMTILEHKEAVSFIIRALNNWCLQLYVSSVIWLQYTISWLWCLGKEVYPFPADWHTFQPRIYGQFFPQPLHKDPHSVKILGSCKIPGSLLCVFCPSI